MKIINAILIILAFVVWLTPAGFGFINILTWMVFDWTITPAGFYTEPRIAVTIFWTLLPLMFGLLCHA
jgi:hypothetical protein